MRVDALRPAANQLRTKTNKYQYQCVCCIQSLTGECNTANVDTKETANELLAKTGVKVLGPPGVCGVVFIICYEQSACNDNDKLRQVE
jgi:hypothetical protein